MITGGLTILRHYLIRFLLRRAQCLPLHDAQFLEDATARSLLRRVGGGYRFTHRLLLEYFADLHTERLPVPAPLGQNDPLDHQMRGT